MAFFFGIQKEKLSCPSARDLHNKRKYREMRQPDWQQIVTLFQSTSKEHHVSTKHVHTLFRRVWTDPVRMITFLTISMSFDARAYQVLPVDHCTDSFVLLSTVERWFVLFLCFSSPSNTIIDCHVTICWVHLMICSAHALIADWTSSRLGLIVTLGTESSTSMWNKGC